MYYHNMLQQPGFGLFLLYLIQTKFPLLIKFITAMPLLPGATWSPQILALQNCFRDFISSCYQDLLSSGFQTKSNHHANEMLS